MNIKTELLNKEEQLTLALREIYESCGYKKYRMNRFEEYNLYMNNKDFLVSESVISFTDLDGKLLALKPDVTLSIVKHAAQAQEQRLYYIENVYRPDKAKRTFCEIGQMGLERIGVIDDYAIAETLYLAAKSLYTVSPDSLLEISHMGFVFGLIRQFNISPENSSRLLKLIAGKNANGIKELAISIGISETDAEVLMQVPFLFGDFDTVIEKARAICLNEESKSALEQLAVIGKLMKSRNDICSVRVDLSLVGEEDYYNGIVFGGYINGLPAKVLSGGQYDRILKKFSKNGGAIGFALYLNELSFILSSKSEFDCDIIIKYTADSDIAALSDYLNLLIAQGKTVYPCPERASTEIRGRECVLFNKDGVKEA